MDGQTARRVRENNATMGPNSSVELVRWGRVWQKEQTGAELGKAQPMLGLWFDWNWLIKNVQMYLWGLPIELYHFVFDAYTVFWLETTFLVYRVVGWVAGFIWNIANSVYNWIGLGLVWACQQQKPGKLRVLKKINSKAYFIKKLTVL